MAYSYFLESFSCSRFLTVIFLERSSRTPAVVKLVLAAATAWLATTAANLALAHFSGRNFTPKFSCAKILYEFLLGGRNTVCYDRLRLALDVSS